jgi:hypothetical protein
MSQLNLNIIKLHLSHDHHIDVLIKEENLTLQVGSSGMSFVFGIRELLGPRLWVNFI